MAFEIQSSIEAFEEKYLQQIKNDYTLNEVTAKDLAKKIFDSLNHAGEKTVAAKPGPNAALAAMGHSLPEKPLPEGIENGKPAE